KTDTSGTINWKGPNGYNSNLKQPFVKDTGWYYLSITTKGGCKGSDSIHVNSDNMNPDVFVSASDTITCNKQLINISGGSMTPNSIITWMGPSGILGNNLNYMVGDSGDYTIIVEGSNGCLNSAMVKVYKILDTPTLILKNDTLDCIKKSTQLNVSIDTSAKYTWTGPNGFNSNLRNPITSVEGEYQISVISKNGCPNFGIINIIKDTIAPQFTLTTDTLNCIKTFISPNLKGDPNITTYQWTGPNNFNSTIINPQINSPGNYNLIVTNSNGCFSNQNFTIVQDTIKPIVIISADEIVCNKQAFIRVNSITANVPFEWTGPNNFRANTLNAQVTKAGWYIINVIGNNGCVRTDSIEVIQKDQLPDLITHDDTLTCSKNSLDLFADSQTSGVKYEWTGPNNFTSTLKNPKTTVGGIYTIKVIDANGCEVSKQINISQLNSSSIIQLSNIDSLDCKKNMTSLVVNSIQNATQLNWTGPNNFTSTNKNITVNSGGWYIVNFINEFGCLTIDSILIVDYRMLPQVTVSDDSINCIRRSIALTLNTSELNLKYNWSGPNGFMSKLKNPLITTGGTFNVTVTNGFNCELVQVINIKLDTTGPDLNLSADTLTCLRPNVPIKAGTSIQGFNISWTGPNGFTSMFPQAIVGTAGTYICTLTNPRTKCTTTKTIEVLEDTNRIRSSVFDKEDASCGLNNGSINIININGGTPTYLYSIDNGLTYLSQSLFDSLSIGTYNIQIKDRNGCVFGGKVSINSTPGVDIDLTPSIDVNINDLITLNLTIKNSNNSTIFWDPSDQLSCNNCANPILNATKDQTINVIVTDENGCSDQASIIVRVRSDVKIYVPNLISPNGDQINEYFYPSSNVDFLINNMSIFSRWGERIFSRDKFMSNSEKDGWNGTYAGEKVNPGVYIYSITYSDGKDIQTLYGDITVLH
ncbi:MAG: gliding motility-associated C-terminal domain-containing protein, partial [Saprospiraceae bacterium]